MKIFISYSKTSSEVANLAEDLSQLGHEVWYDKELENMAGQTWWDAILENIRACNLFIFAISVQSLKSDACKREYTYADALDKPILPVIISKGINIENVPTILQKIQSINYANFDKSAYRILIKSLSNIHPAEAWSNSLNPEPPEIPYSPLAKARDRLNLDKLTEEQQVTLLHDLKLLAAQPQYAMQARDMLREFSKHRYTLGSIYREIQELLQLPGGSISGSDVAVNSGNKVDKDTNFKDNNINKINKDINFGDTNFTNNEVLPSIEITLFKGRFSTKRLRLSFYQDRMIATSIKADFDSPTIEFEIYYRNIIDIDEKSTLFGATNSVYIKTSDDDYTFSIGFGFDSPQRLIHEINDLRPSS